MAGPIDRRHAASWTCLTLHAAAAAFPLYMGEGKLGGSPSSPDASGRSQGQHEQADAQPPPPSSKGTAGSDRSLVLMLAQTDRQTDSYGVNSSLQMKI